MSTFECSSPYNTEYICNDKLSKCCQPSCYNCCSRYYSNIVMVAGLLMSVFGIVDFFKGGELAIVCPENDALFSSLMLAQGVISMIEGVMIFCSIGRAHGYSLFRSGLPTFQYAFNGIFLRYCLDVKWPAGESNHVTCTKGRKLYLHGILFLHILSPFYQHIRLIVSSNTSSDHLCAVMLLWDCKRVFNSWFRLIKFRFLIDFFFIWIRGKNGTIRCTLAWIK